MAQLIGPTFGSQAGGPPRQLVVLLHGVGADGNDLIGLAPMLAERLPHALFVAPDGPEPCDMAPYGRQWFSLQDRRPAVMLAGRRGARRRCSTPISTSCWQRHGLATSQHGARRLLAGHHDVAVRRAAPRPAPGRDPGLFRARCSAPGAVPREARSRPPVMLVHGDADDVVPVEALFMAVEGLQAAEIPVQWIVRPGLPHSIDPDGIDAGGRFLASTLRGEATADG